MYTVFGYDYRTKTRVSVVFSVLKIRVTTTDAKLFEVTCANFFDVP